MKTGSVCIETLHKDRVGEAASVLASCFVQHNPLHKALRIDQIRYQQHLVRLLQSLQQTNAGNIAHSFVACENNEEKNEEATILGVIVGFDFNLNITIEPARELAPLFTLLRALSRPWALKQKPANGDYFLVDMAAVASHASGLGIYQALRQRVTESARDAGFSFIIGELSSTATQHVLVEKADHEVVNEINIASFAHGDGQPFKDVKSPATVQLVISRIHSADNQTGLHA